MSLDRHQLYYLWDNLYQVKKSFSNINIKDCSIPFDKRLPGPMKNY